MDSLGIRTLYGFSTATAPGVTYSQRLKEKKLEEVKKGLRPFRCPWPSCESAFKKKHHLRQHYCIHTGERKYQCSYCDYSAIDHTTFKRHVLAKHKDNCQDIKIKHKKLSSI